MLQIRINKFEGPLALLLKLIEKQEMDITEVSLAHVADQYIDYVKNSGDINPEEMSDFLVIAAQLLYIKSKALLPYLTPEEEDEDGEELEKQLRMYKEFLQASENIDSLARKNGFMYCPDIKNIKRYCFKDGTGFSPPKGITKKDLHRTILSLVRTKKKKKRELQEEKIEHQVNIEEKISSIKNLVLKRINFSFNKILNTSKTKTETIVSFLAILELSKQKFVVLEQEKLFSEIIINRRNN